MLSRVFASAKVDCPEGQGYDVLTSLTFRRVFPVTERGGFLVLCLLMFRAGKFLNGCHETGKIY
jgi:hypothetical protein